ncbi:sugar phosphate isomerase/epimerase family protein, partial [Desulfohalovibrio reitneri]|uniref:sugar phosphate isomerase/epimerase family protein n=1 Tax=Desulfohalovibrio reitneri TaxID=1307759 RepID=UPI0004A706B0
MPFANLPLRYVHERPRYLKLFLSQSIRPELGLDAWAIDQPGEAWHRHVTSAFASAGLPRAIHLPFDDLHPASEDPVALRAARIRLGSAVEIARIHDPVHLIGHPTLGHLPFEGSARRQHEAGVESWLEVLAAWGGDHPPLYLENTFDSDPVRLRDLVAEVAERAPGTVGICFDVGHWHTFSHGAAKKDLGFWLETLGAYIGHVHLHDNFGRDDDHLGIGAGAVPWDELLERMAAIGTRPTVTLEPHSEEDYAVSARYLAEHAERLGKVFSL